MPDAPFIAFSMLAEHVSGRAWDKRRVQWDWCSPATVCWIQLVAPARAIGEPCILLGLADDAPAGRIGSRLRMPDSSSVRLRVVRGRSPSLNGNVPAIAAAREGAETGTVGALIGQTIARDVTIPGTRFVAEKGVIEARCDGFVPDVLLHGPKGELLAIEVCVTHKVSRAKQQRVAEHALPMIQFSIDLADDSSAEAAELEQRLRESTPEWIFHPKEAELRLQLEAEVEAALHQLQDEQKARQEELQPMLSDGTTDLFTEVDRRRGDSSPLRAQTGPDQFEVLGCQVVVNVATTAGVWACTASLPLQEQILHQITADAGDHGLRVTAPIHTTSHGIVIVAGAAVRSWASGLARRLCKAFPDNVTPEELES